MNALLLSLVLGQATVQIRVTVAKPLCVVVDEAGAATVVPKRSLKGGERVTGCANAQGSGVPRIEQHVESAATADQPEVRVIEVIY